MPEISQRVSDKAEAIQHRLNSTITSVRADSNLSQEGKLRKLAAAYLTAERDMGELRETWQQKASDDGQTLGRDVFGAASTLGVNAISARDADDRASRLESANDAIFLLARAEENGDEVLSRAIAQHAYARRNEVFGGWSSVLDAYTETRPKVAEKLSALEDARRDTIRTNLAAGMTFSLARPRELSHIYNLQAVADGTVPTAAG